MTIYLVRRFIQGIVVLFLSTFIIYTLLINMPGGPRDYVNQIKQGLAGGDVINPRIRFS